MKKIFSVVFLGLFIFSTYAQVVRRDKRNDLYLDDSTTFNREVKVKLDGKTKYTDYKIIDMNNDTTIVDTTLTIKKYYKFNYLRKDDFELLPFHNQGQTFNKLGYRFFNSSIFPKIGVNAKQYNYYTVNDINYYEVPTPTSEIMYRTGLEQGQVLDAFLTLNTSKQLNISIAYKGLRSLGKYRNTLASHGNFRTSVNYHSKNKRYYLKGHFSSFDLLNNENGGLTAQSVVYFENNNPNYIERARLDVNFTNADNMFEGKRYYVNQSFSLIKKKADAVPKKPSKSVSIPQKKTNSILKAKLHTKKDSVKNNVAILNKKEKGDATVKPVKKDSVLNLSTNKIAKIDIKIGHILEYETKHYRYNQQVPSSLFGDAIENTVNDHTSYQKFNNELYAQLSNPIIGQLTAKINYFKYNYHYNSILYFNNGIVSDNLKGDIIAAGATWKTTYGPVYLNAEASTIISGNLTGNTIKAEAMLKKDSIFEFKGFAEVTSKTPDFNKMLYQSSYVNYNWQNNFKNESIKVLGASFSTKLTGTVEASYNLIDNYTYFDENSIAAQDNGSLSYLRLKYQKEIKLGKFALDNTILYQKVTDGASFFRVPEILTRNSFYFSDYVFKGKPLYLQTGVTFKYFTAFYANAYNPVLSEFVIQNDTKIGNFPIFDFFANAQIQRTRLYLKVENFTASFTGRNYYSAPNYPYRDLTVRFGLVWNFFI